MKIQVTLAFLAAFALFTAQNVFADILMIDLNASTDELAAAQKSAAARQEKLVLLPPRTAAEQTNYNKLHQIEFEEDDVRTRTSLTMQLIDKAQKASNPTKVRDLTQRLNQLNAKLTDLQQRSAAITKDYPGLGFDYEMLRSALQSASKSGEKFETVIVSGHHGSDYFGLLGSIDLGEIGSAFRQFPEIQKSVKSVFAWGCYSATPAEALNWQSFLPNLKLLGGYDDSAPGSGKLADTEYLSAILGRDRVLQKTAEQAESASQLSLFKHQLHDLQGFDATNAAACTRVACVGINTETVSLNDLGKSCDQKGRDLLVSERDQVEGTVYCDTQHSPLRNYYNHARLYEHCASVDVAYADYDPNQILRQLFLKNIWANFQLYYAKQIQELNQAEKTCTYSNFSQIDLNLPLKCLPASEDQSGITMDQLTSAWANFTGQDLCPGEANDLTSFVPTFRKAFGLMYRNPLKFNLHCLPGSWVEPAASRAQLEPPPKDCEN